MSSEVTTMTTLATRYEPIGGGERDYATLLRAAERARFVLLGEATRGSHELYAERARITRMLIERHGFDAVAVEADWPDAYRVNRFVRGEPGDANARAALSGFERFPTWMWRNAVVLDFVAWLREHNLGPSAVRPVGFYGLDMYCLYTSIGLVLAHLDRVDPAAARAARDCYATYSRFGDDALAYGLAALRGLVPSSMVRCEEEVVRRLVAERKALAAGGVAAASRDERFQAERNARLVASAEAYYRAMYRGRDSSWNLRDGHMLETLAALDEHLSEPGRPTRIVVWAHNSHLGDARATSMATRGELNLGQLARERWGEPAEQVLSVGFTTFSGTVTAASSWDAPAEHKRVQRGLPGSIEALLHDVARRCKTPRFVLDLRRPEVAAALAEPRLERAIGVLYLPETERDSHYFRASVARQFDVLVHIDETRAVEPLEPGQVWHRGREEPPETYPSGL